MQATYVIGYEHGGRGSDALALGKDLDAFADARLIVASVSRSGGEARAGERGVPTSRRAALRADVGDELFGYDWDVRAEVGEPVSAVLAALAVREGAQLIILGSSRRAAPRRTLLGEVAGALLNAAPCAVAIAPRGFAAEGRSEIARIGVAFNGSAESEHALETAVGIAAPIGARVALCAVDDPRLSDATADPGSLGDRGAPPSEPGTVIRGIVTRALAWMPAGVSAEPRFGRGEKGPALASLSAGLDLMVIGSRGGGPARLASVGATGRDLVAASACPVVVTPRGAGAGAVTVRGLREAGSVLAAGPGLGAD